MLCNSSLLQTCARADATRDGCYFEMCVCVAWRLCKELYASARVLSKLSMSLLHVLFVLAERTHGPEP